MSIALEICRIAEDQVGLEVLPRVREVCVIVGDDSGVELANLQFCLDVLLDHDPFRKARATLARTAGSELRVDYLEVDDDRPTH
jgi:Zn finger protein HypA/HybF involved in hydrogenase expression